MQNDEIIINTLNNIQDSMNLFHKKMDDVAKESTKMHNDLYGENDNAMKKKFYIVWKWFQWLKCTTIVGGAVGSMTMFFIALIKFGK